MHGKWSELITVFTQQMVSIDHDFYMAYGLNWFKMGNGLNYHEFDMANSLNWSGFLHGKCFWIDQDCCMANGLNWSHILNVKWYELFTIFICEMVWIDQVFYMGNGLNWSEGLHGKWSELIRFFYMENSLNWSGGLHSKWCGFIGNVIWQLVWIVHELYIAYGLN